MNPLTRTPHSTCHQHTASIDADNTTERVDGQECYPFNIYQTTPTSTDLPLNSTNNHHRWTLSEITVRKRLFICRFQTQTHSNIQTQHSGPTQIATRQPNLSIASQQTGVSVQQNKGNEKFLFNITKSYTQTPYIIPTNIRQYSGSPLSFYDE